MDDIEEAKAKYLNHQFLETTFEIDDAERMAAVASACGETLGKFTDPNDPDFQGTPAFASSLIRGRNLPEDFPTFGGLPMDGGKDVQPVKPIRAGMTLTGKSHVHDIYTKSGRSGRMIFVLSRTELFDQDGDLTTIADTRLVIRERAEK